MDQETPLVVITPGGAQEFIYLDLRTELGGVWELIRLEPQPAHTTCLQDRV